MAIHHRCVDGNQGRVILDSGSTLLGIAERILYKDKSIEYTIKRITFGDRVKTFRTTTVNVNCPFLKGRHEVVVLPRLIVELLVGNLPTVLNPTGE